MKLHQLPDGTWVDPGTIRCIRVLSFRERGATLPAPRVIVSTPDAVLVLDCESDEDAEALRDRIAAVANEAVGPALPRTPYQAPPFRGSVEAVLAHRDPA
jgi:hypothetical protein